MTARVSDIRHGHVLYLTLENAGRKNALSVALLQSLKTAIAAVDADETRIVFLRGAGGMFSAGADLEDITGTGRDADYDQLTREVSALIHACPCPVVVLIDGACMGAAVELALSCDMRIAAADAFFQVPATRLGLLYKPDAIAALGKRFALDTLIRLFVLGARFNAAEAMAAGLVTQVADGDGIEHLAETLAGNAGKTDPTAAGLTRKLLLELEAGSADMAAWNAQYHAILSSPARKAGLDALKAQLKTKTGNR